MEKEKPPERYRELNQAEEDSINRDGSAGMAVGNVVPPLTVAGQYEISSQHEHKRMVEEVLELTAELYKARNGRMPDEGFMRTKRNAFAGVDDNNLRLETGNLRAKLNQVGR